MRVSILAALIFCAATIAHAESGIASVYGGSDGYCGKPVAAGGVLDCKALTAAVCALDGCDWHKRGTWLPFGTMIKVRNRASGKSIAVKIVDRGPFVKGRIIDLTPAAAMALGCPGLCEVEIGVISGFVPASNDLFRGAW